MYKGNKCTSYIFTAYRKRNKFQRDKTCKKHRQNSKILVLFNSNERKIFLMSEDFSSIKRKNDSKSLRK